MFIPLKNRTTYSLCKGAIRIGELVAKAKEFSFPAVGICDFQYLSGALEFSLECQKNSIQPIIGVEILIDFFDTDKSGSEASFQQTLAKATLIASTDEGFKNLMHLVSKSFVERSPGIAPHITFTSLCENSSGIVLLSGGTDGIISKLLLEKQDQRLQNLISRIKSVFDINHFYLEISRHGTEVERKLEPLLLDLAKNSNIPLVAINDTYFLDREMHKAQEILSCIGQARVIADPEREILSQEQYFKTAAQMEELFSDIPEAIENTRNIAMRCLALPKKRKPSLPLFKGESTTSDDELELQSTTGLEERLSRKFASENTPKEEQEKIKEKYFSRLSMELSIIKKVNFANYFLIVSDFVKWSKNHDIPVGPGRGSGAGSIIAWALKITDLDPIRFGLIFERFLNPERLSMPDFDIDFCQARRDEVIEYVQQKYGHEFVGQIITFGKLQAKAVLKDVGRVIQIPYNQVDRICKLIPFNAVEAVTLKKAIEMDKDLQKEIKSSPEIGNLVDIALKLEGMNRHVSTHAAGIVIGDKKLSEICPLYRDESGSMPAVSYSMKYAEEAGLVKFDFLGLKTLTMISEAVRLIKQIRGIDIDIANIPLDDKKTFDMLSTGNSIGVFQIESLGMRSVLRQMKADKIEDIIALISLYRPGPMDNIPTYIKRKHGQEKIAYLHDLLEGTLKETYGVIVYQEQVMEIARILGGYSLAAADLLRRAMGKKIKEEMEEQREIFLDGASKNNIDKSKASEIFDVVAKFAGYGFNKSHAAAYATISYQTAYIKANFPEEFFVSSVNHEIGNSDKIGNLLQDAKNAGIKILPPDINKSFGLFSIEKSL